MPGNVAIMRDWAGGRLLNTYSSELLKLVQCHGLMVLSLCWSQGCIPRRTHPAQCCWDRLQSSVGCIRKDTRRKLTILHTAGRR